MIHSFIRTGLLTSVIIVFCAAQLIFGQESYQAMDNIRPPSPEAGSVAKQASLPVSYYTGTLSVNIPLWLVSGRRLELPVEINYHASGIKVDEIPGRCGLGWSLTAGGAVTRLVQGLPDDLPGGYLSNNGNFLPSLDDEPGSFVWIGRCNE